MVRGSRFCPRAPSPARPVKVPRPGGKTDPTRGRQRERPFAVDSRPPSGLWAGWLLADACPFSSRGGCRSPFSGFRPPPTPPRRSISSRPSELASLAPTLRLLSQEGAQMPSKVLTQASRYQFGDERGRFIRRGGFYDAPVRMRRPELTAWRPRGRGRWPQWWTR